MHLGRPGGGGVIRGNCGSVQREEAEFCGRCGAVLPDAWEERQTEPIWGSPPAVPAQRLPPRRSAPAAAAVTRILPGPDPVARSRLADPADSSPHLPAEVVPPQRADGGRPASAANRSDAVPRAGRGHKERSWTARHLDRCPAVLRSRLWQQARLSPRPARNGLPLRTIPWRGPTAELSCHTWLVCVPDGTGIVSD